MAFSSNAGSGSAMSEINVTPLVDVMLVLLIIFMITAPQLTHHINIDLPQPNPNTKPPENPPEPLRLTIQADGSLYLNDVPISEAGLKLQLEVYGSRELDKQPELQIAANDNAQYDVMAHVLADAKSVGMQKIGFRDMDQ
ncbi:MULTISPECIES: biopolymer transporter ExbD [Oleiagrimonas]|uniref:Biopolymer transporter ExbD n=1 Tax=Oleiagrimonas citrea TaxID=1665687 RepID=A0A846ZRB8_9GAMM|nr:MULTISPECIES: biopolymer transporter ExbD [Oleiagrimonas]NKZ40078.1 biopolymer transporter ExbD [Oleiagrimonas citrea]RAP57125.1 biopolymer transporter ExbD [Oleiagrimonas sp. MCCC 1A03011]